MISLFRRKPQDKGVTVGLGSNCQSHHVEQMTTWCSDNIGSGGWVGPACGHFNPQHIWSVLTCCNEVLFSFKKTSDGDKFRSHFGVE